MLAIGDTLTLKGMKAAIGYTVIRSTVVEITEHGDYYAVLCENHKEKISPYVCWYAFINKLSGEVSYESGVYTDELEIGFGWYERRGGR